MLGEKGYNNAMEQPQLKTAPIYVSEDDFNNWTGKNLSAELNDSTTPDRFLRDAEDDVLTFINLQSWRPISHLIRENWFTDEQMYALKAAILEQADYVFYNGDAYKNSGLDPEGKRLDRDDLNRVAISQRTIDRLIETGVMTLVMHGRG